MAFTPAYGVNGSTDKVLHQKAHTSLWSLLRGAPYTKGKGLKAAFVEITFTSGDVYTTAGVNVDLLTNLPGWTKILSVISDPFVNPNSTSTTEKAWFVAQNDATVGNRLMILNEVAPGIETTPIEAANSRVLTDCTVVALVLGY